MLYTSIQNKKIIDLKKLNQKKYRDKKKMFLIEGRHLVLEAYKTGHLKELLLEQDEIFPLDVETHYLTNDVIHYITSLESPSTVLGLCQKKYDEQHLGDRIVVLDDIQDPGNLGTIIRSAVAFHVDTIILGENCVDLYNEKVIRSTQGMLFHMNIIRTDLYQKLPELKREGYTLLGTKVTHGKCLKEFSAMDKFVLIMGNEGNGVKDDILALCDTYVYIDMDPRCESLNVGVATSIILYQLDK